MLKDRHDAFRLLERLGAPALLLAHVREVCAAADRLLEVYGRLGIECDAYIVELGAAMHDAGKILYPEELDGPGSRHEPSGQTLLLAHDVPVEITRFCVSHGTWDRAEVSFEECTVALADTLCQKIRDPRLEDAVIDAATERCSARREDIQSALAQVFREMDIA